MPRFSDVDWFPLWLSLRVAALATLISLTVGLALAYALANWRFRGKEALDALGNHWEIRDSTEPSPGLTRFL